MAFLGIKKGHNPQKLIFLIFFFWSLLSHPNGKVKRWFEEDSCFVLPRTPYPARSDVCSKISIFAMVWSKDIGPINILCYWGPYNINIFLNTELCRLIIIYGIHGPGSTFCVFLVVFGQMTSFFMENVQKKKG